MNATFRAELIKLRRPRILAATLGLSLLFAVATALAVILPGGTDLEQAGGATEAFATGLSFTGILVFVVFIANFASEFSQGTFRTLLMRQPDRLALLAGKLGALLAFAAVLLGATLVLTALASTAVASTQGISTGAWLSADGLGAAVDDYARVALSWGAWATLGMALAVVVRSAPIALGVGIAWSGPFEHLLMDAWRGAGEWFPGLLLEDLASDGADARVSILLALYVVLAAAVAAATLKVRDVSA